jgi:hypothetical protein
LWTAVSVPAIGTGNGFGRGAASVVAAAGATAGAAAATTAASVAVEPAAKGASAAGTGAAADAVPPSVVSGAVCADAAARATPSFDGAVPDDGPPELAVESIGAAVSNRFATSSHLLARPAASWEGGRGGSVAKAAKVWHAPVERCFRQSVVSGRVVHVCCRMRQGERISSEEGSVWEAMPAAYRRIECQLSDALWLQLTGVRPGRRRRSGCTVRATGRSERGEFGMVCAAGPSPL